MKNCDRILIFAILLIFCISILIVKCASSRDNISLSIDKYNNNGNDILNKLINRLNTGAKKWIQQNDNDIVTKSIHSNYSAAHLYMIEELTDKTEFNKITGEDLSQLHNRIISERDKITSGDMVKSVRYLPLAMVLQAIDI